ncbi:ABC transporter permease [Nocardioides mangrovicus]|uniref:ABC transporter permease n=1 Tax=Nocardioides mangrovicus TaxID=2478913 RepID=A0A3L8P462_9ACTN|nr:ABC transporter permease [Nocardioides mangrovicus]RLV50196.1 ABC transporter permease [Nocardioides mangrovicus]
MFAYTMRRIFAGVIMLILMSLVTYVLFFSGGLHPERAACGKNCSPAQWEQTKKALGYDKPAVVQWGEFLKGTVAGRTYPEDKALAKANPSLVSTCPAPCLGYSVVNTTNVSTEVKTAFPVSFSLAILAFIMWIVGGVFFGVIAALRRGTVVDRGIVGVSLIFYAFPTFWIGLFFLKFFAIQWQIFPVPSYVNLTDSPLAWLGNLVLPSLTLALIYMAGYVRMTRAFVLESFGEDYLRTARAKGLPNRRVLVKHSLRASLTPIVTMAGLDFGALVGGAIITESVFNYDGLGALAVDSVRTLDLPTIVGLVVVLAAFIILANIVVDILYAVIDPRVRLG